MSQVNLSFPDSVYSSSSKPQVATIKADFSALEIAHNDTDTNAVRDDGTVAFSANQSMGGFKITSLAAPTAATDAASIGAAWPIGSVFTSVVSTNPATLLGFGTWAAIAAGKVLIGLDSGDATMDTAEETGGAKTSTALIAHTHTGTTGNESNDHTHTTGSLDGHSGTTVAGTGATGIYTMDTPITRESGAPSATHTHSFTSASTGSGSSFSIMNPFFVVFFWKRTA